MEPKENTVPKTPSEEAAPKSAPTWEYKTDFPINALMQDMALMTKLVVEGEVQRLRRKLEKLKYGS